MRRIYLILSLFGLLSCSTRAIENFFTDLSGTYRVNAAGAVFLLRTFPQLSISNNASIVSDNSGRFSYSNSSTGLVTPLFSIEGTPRSAQSGVFVVEGQQLYFGVELENRSNLMFSSNIVFSPDEAEFFFLLPVANKQ
ncbi:MAG: hypothetical protein ACRC9L_09200 [Brevinema sp.]